MNIVQTNFMYLSPLSPLNVNNVKYIVLHHTGVESAKPEDIHQWHLDNGWSGFGYNEYILKDGTVYIGRGNHVGAHTQGYNAVSYGICCEGNYDIEKNIATAQMDSLAQRVRFQNSYFPNVQKIVGHGELNKTYCPGKYFPFKTVMDRVNKPLDNPHWAKKDNDELLSSGILKSDHTETLDNFAREGMVISLVNRLRKGDKQ